MSSLGDETPEGHAIVVIASEASQLSPTLPANADIVPFSANTRMSGIDFEGQSYRKGAVDSVLKSISSAAEAGFTDAATRIGRAGSTPLAVTANGQLLSVIELKDIVKPGICERFAV